MPMLNFALHVPITAEGLQPYLEALGDDRRWCGLEVSAAMLDDESGWEDMLDAFERPLVSLSDLLPPNVSRYLVEAGDVARHALIDCLGRLVERAAATGVSYTSFDLGLERGGHTLDDAGFAARVDLLRTLLPLTQGLDLITCGSCRA